MTPGDGLRRLAHSYRRRRRAAAGVFIIGIVVLVFLAARHLGAPIPPGVGAAAAGLVAALLVRRLFSPVDAGTVARHVDRTIPGAEESSGLLLRDPSDTALLDRMQRKRVEASLSGTTLPIPPDSIAARAAASGAAALLVSVAILLVPARASSDPPFSSAAKPAPDTPPRLLQSVIEIIPPRYTRRPARTQHVLEIDAEEGAELHWTFRVAGRTERPRLITSLGDTITLARNGEGALEARLRATRSLIYQLALDSLPDPSEIHRLIVRPDAAPEVTVLRPAPRSEIPAGAALRIPVEVLIADDHGAASAELVATVTTGSGESVRFREQRIPLPSPRGAAEGARLRAALDLDALGMAPGDELYFHVLAADSRPGTPNTGRSATVFISLADTAAASPPLVAGVALPGVPEYFRSQRQVIIDTERLVADAARLPTDIFRERSNAIGIDQGLLRLRYGEFTGEEFAEEVDAAETHDHDSEENATLLAPSVKATLKAAIAQMWDAELRLRTYRPAEALPFEYRALELLKSVQQASRAYVQRVGFEPPPLEIDQRRLTGRIDGVRNRSVSDSAAGEDDRAASRRALALLRELAVDAGATTADRSELAAAEDELGRLALAGPERHLDAVRRLRVLRASLRQGLACDGCIADAEAALRASLPPPPPAAAPRIAGGALARRYAELLRNAR